MFAYRYGDGQMLRDITRQMIAMEAVFSQPDQAFSQPHPETGVPVIALSTLFNDPVSQDLQAYSYVSRLALIDAAGRAFTINELVRTSQGKAQILMLLDVMDRFCREKDTTGAYTHALPFRQGERLPHAELMSRVNIACGSTSVCRELGDQYIGSTIMLVPVDHLDEIYTLVLVDANDDQGHIYQVVHVESVAG